MAGFVMGQGKLEVSYGLACSVFPRVGAAIPAGLPAFVTGQAFTLSFSRRTYPA